MASLALVPCAVSAIERIAASCLATAGVAGMDRARCRVLLHAIGVCAFLPSAPWGNRGRTGYRTGAGAMAFVLQESGNALQCAHTATQQTASADSEFLSG